VCRYNCETPPECVPYLSALEVWSRQSDIYVYRYRYLTFTGCSAPSDGVFRELCTNSLTYLVTNLQGSSVTSGVNSLGRMYVGCLGGNFLERGEFSWGNVLRNVRGNCPEWVSGSHAGLLNKSLYIQQLWFQPPWLTNRHTQRQVSVAIQLDHLLHVTNAYTNRTSPWSALGVQLNFFSK